MTYWLLVAVLVIVLVPPVIGVLAWALMRQARRDLNAYDDLGHVDSHQERWRP